MEDEGFFAHGARRATSARSAPSARTPATAWPPASSTRRWCRRTAERLMADDLFTGWGMRTLSSKHPAYNPYSYHRGSVWPVEHGTFALGFLRYGLHDHVEQLCRAQFEAAALFDFYRLPELFSGHQRDARSSVSGALPGANSPQAWSASAVFCFVQAMLGLYPYAPLNLLLVDPHLPDWLPEITLAQPAGRRRDESRSASIARRMARATTRCSTSAARFTSFGSRALVADRELRRAAERCAYKPAAGEIERTTRMSEKQKSSEVVVITGASAGVGRATARAFAEAGRNWACSRAGATGSKARAARSRRRAAARSCCRPTWPTRTQSRPPPQHVESEFGPIDIWINNAMVSVFSPVKEMTAGGVPPRDRSDLPRLCLRHARGAQAHAPARPRRDRAGRLGARLPRHPAAVGLLRRQACHSGFHDSLRCELLHDESRTFA